MKKLLNLLFTLIVGILFTMCSGDEKEIIAPPQKVIDSYTLSINATRGIITRTLTDNGTSITASWSTSDIVKVYKGDWR